MSQKIKRTASYIIHFFISTPSKLETVQDSRVFLIYFWLVFSTSSLILFYRIKGLGQISYWLKVGKVICQWSLQQHPFLLDHVNVVVVIHQRPSKSLRSFRWYGVCSIEHSIILDLVLYRRSGLVWKVNLHRWFIVGDFILV